MRIAKLRLERYGVFENKSLEFPADRLCIVYGANEAGKSTALAALSDLLYGFPHLAAYDFRFDAGELRIGGDLVDSAGKSLHFRRRRGRKNTLLDDDDRPIADGAIVPFIGRSDRDLFERAFGLNHERLRGGGKALMSDGGDLGEALVEAGSGIQSLVKRQKNLQGEAESIYDKRKSQSRRFYVALDRYEDGRAKLKTALLSAREWQEATKAIETADSRRNECLAQLAEARDGLAKVARLKHALPIIREIDVLLGRNAALDGVPELPEDADLQRTTAIRDRAGATSEIARLSQAEAQVEQALLQEPVSDELLARAEDIHQAYQQRGEIVGFERDLPKREAEIDKLRDDMQDLARRIGLPRDVDISSVQPSEPKLRQVRTLIQEGTSLRTALETSQVGASRAQAAVRELEEELSRCPEREDPASMRRRLDPLRENLPLEKEIEGLRAQLGELEAEIARRLAALPHWTKTRDELAAAPLPVKATIRRFEKDFAGLEKRGELAAEERRRIEEEIERQRRRLAELTAEGEIATREAVLAARSRRDEAWALIRRAYIAREAGLDGDIAAVSSGGPIGVAYEHRVAKADELADRREAEAKRVAEFAAATASLGIARDELGRNGQSQDAVCNETERLLEEWSDLWAAFGVRPLRPTEMLEWLDQVDPIRDACAERVNVGNRIAERSRTLEEAHRAAVRFAAELSLTIQEKLAFGEIARTIGERLDEDQRNWQERQALQAKRGQALIAKRKADESYAENLIKHEAWSSKWEALLPEIGLAGGASPQEADAACELWAQVVGARKKRTELEHRIGAMRMSCEKFASDVQRLCLDAAPDAAQLSATEACLRIFERLGAAEKHKAIQSGRQENLDGIRAEKSAQEIKLADAQNRIAALKALARTPDEGELEKLIRSSNERRSILQQIEEARKRLSAAADGFSEEQMRRELGETSLEGLTADEIRLQADVQTRTAAWGEANIEVERAQVGLRALRARGSAEQAEQEMQSSLAELGEHAADWARLRIASILLTEAIERYRDRNQDPLVQRASKHFRLLTGGSFERLAVHYGDDDKPKLGGRRASGELCPIEGMSDGTRDQLYLSLRLASLEAYCKKEEPLPFVADDLFIHFDDERAAAGLDALASLTACQTLVFTHHRHLVDIAEKALTGRVRVVEM